MTSEAERRLRSALVPVDPPGSLSDRLERRLTTLSDAAAEELADWELRAMEDPRNWGRVAGAVVVGAAAGGALVLVRARQRQRRRPPRGVRGFSRNVRGAIADVRGRVRR